MAYKLDAENIGIPYSKEIFRIINDVIDKHNCEFMIIGATARDLNFLIVYDYREDIRATRDIDFGIAISDWSKFDLIVQDLVELGFEKNRGIVHRLEYLGTPIDLVPFGGIEVDGDITWPTDFSPEMSVAGFREVFAAALEFEMPDGVSFKVVTLSGIVILKIIAWHDRKDTTQKDGEDILFLLRYYVEIDKDALFSENDDLLDKPDSNYALVGAQIIARKIKSILAGSPTVKEKINSIITEETFDIETSKLAQVRGYNNNTLENYALLKAFRDELKL